MTLHAFIDESIRGRSYMICAAIVDAQGIPAARQVLRSLLRPGQRRTHFNRESDERRKRILETIATFDLECIICVAHHSDQQAARARSLSQVVACLCKRGVVQVVLESREGQNHRDRAVIRQAMGASGARPFQYYHEVPTREPLLWVPDAVAWAWGRDRDWKRSVKRLGLVDRVWKA